MELHYTQMDSKLRQTESQQVDIGKPLVASCKLHMRNQAPAAKKQEGASAQSMGNVSSSKPQTPAGPRRPFTRKAECAPPKVAVATRSNQPEENDENEL